MMVRAHEEGTRLYASPLEEPLLYYTYLRNWVVAALFERDAVRESSNMAQSVVMSALKQKA